MRMNQRLVKGFVSIGTVLLLSACGNGSESSSSEGKAKALAPVCGLTPSCDTKPLLGRAEGFIGKKPKGDAWHFGRDQYVNEVEDQWVIGKIQYGNYFFRSPLVGEKVEVQLLRTCGGSWEVLGNAFTTKKGDHPTINNFEDEGGMIYFKIPEDKRLELGRHRIRLVVAGDQTAAELFLEVLPQGAQIFVSDVDGTLTTSELIEGLASVLNTQPPAHPGAATQFQNLSKKGYRPLYLTARSSNLVQRTRDFVSQKKFPQGMIMTSSASTLGLSGSVGAAYKSKVLQGLEERGFRITYAFGNTKTDAEAFANANIPDNRKFFYKFEDFDAFGGGIEFEDYSKLSYVSSAENLCQL